MKRKCIKNYGISTNDNIVISFLAGMIYDVEYFKDDIAVVRGIEIPAGSFDKRPINELDI